MQYYHSNADIFIGFICKSNMSSKDIIEHMMTTGLLVNHDDPIKINYPDYIKPKDKGKAINAETWDNLPEEARESLSKQGFYRQILVKI